MAASRRGWRRRSAWPSPVLHGAFRSVKMGRHGGTEIWSCARRPAGRPRRRSRSWTVRAPTPRAIASRRRRDCPQGMGGPMSADVLEALQTSRAWINYSPARPFDFVAGQHPVTESQLQTELSLLSARGFRGLVTNAMTYGLEAAPRVAKRLGFHHVIA